MFIANCPSRIMEWEDSSSLDAEHAPLYSRTLASRVRGATRTLAARALC